MKALKLSIVLISILAFFSCKEVKEQTDMEKYVNALKTGQYADRDLPAFTFEHIDELLKYRNEKDSITVFPRNLLSSSYQKKCELGVYVLWTVESIRLVAIDSEYLIGRFTSQNPFFRLREPVDFIPVNNEEVYQIASDAYYTWWTNNQDKSVDDIMKIDPLENTLYTWH
jgi:hypothetical protein